MLHFNGLLSENQRPGVSLSCVDSVKLFYYLFFGWMVWGELQFKPLLPRTMCKGAVLSGVWRSRIQYIVLKIPNNLVDIELLPSRTQSVSTTLKNSVKIT